MKNFDVLLRDLFDNSIQLSADQRKKMRSRRDINRTRLDIAFGKLDPPLSSERVMQGSYAMNTMVQSDIEVSDIDDAVIIRAEDLMGKRGAELSALDARKLVADALTDDRLKSKPIVHTNCVRVEYHDGGALDVPVYRKCVDGNGNVTYERASSEWLLADPNSTVEWFKGAVANQGSQLRRMVKLVKAWSKSRRGWDMPTGYFLSILVWEAYSGIVAKDDRDDEAFYLVLKSMLSRLDSSLIIRDPVSNDQVTKTSSEASVRDLREELPVAIALLEKFMDESCTEADAMKTFKSIFNTSHFDAALATIAVTDKKIGFTTSGAGTPQRSVTKSEQTNTFG